MMKAIAAALLTSTLTLASCGFTPLYSTENGAVAGSIQIPEIEGYAGHQMRRELLMLLRPGLPGIDSATLEVIYDEDVLDFAFRNDGTTSRTRIEGKADYVLTTADGVMTGTINSSANLAPSTTPYADISARREASVKAALDAATQLANELRIRTGRGDAFQRERSRKNS
ncbi:MAG: hypothetical protein CMK07_02560 [Ponticaulis sp.]|nr:hypothetical protein [Ponticaulis sp.]